MWLAVIEAREKWKGRGIWQQTMGKEMLHLGFLKPLIYFTLRTIKEEVELLSENLPPILQDMCLEV